MSLELSLPALIAILLVLQPGPFIAHALLSNTSQLECLNSEQEFITYILQQHSVDLISDQLVSRLGDVISVCLGSQGPKIRNVSILLPSISNTVSAFLPYLTNLLEKEIGGIPVSWTVTPVNQMAAAVIADVMDGTNFYDGYIIEGQAVVDIASVQFPSGGPPGAFQDLAPWIRADPELQWSDINRYIREVGSVYDGKIVGMPLYTTLPYLYYRRDIFQQYNLDVPSTWDEMVALALAMNGTDFNNDGLPDFSACFALSSVDFPPYTMLAILASMVQTGGYTNGFLFSPLTLQPLVNNPAMAKVLAWYRTLETVNKPFYTLNNPDPGRLNPFATGECLITISSGSIFKAALSAVPQVQGQIGVGMVPGSTEVLDRDTLRLVPCRPDLCSDTVLINGSVVSLNRTPFYGPFGVSLVVAQGTDPTYKAIMYKLASFLASPAVHGPLLAYNPRIFTTPIRDSEMSDSTIAAGKWSAYNVNDTRPFLQVTRDTLAHPNIAKDVAVLNSADFMDAISAAAVRTLTTSASIADIMRRLESTMQAILLRQNHTLALLSYRKYLGYAAPLSPAPEAQGGGLSTREVMVVVIVPVTVLGGLLALFWCFWLWRTRQLKLKHTLLGVLMAPGVGEQVTLVLTDIQDSTMLWEHLPPETMDQALSLHHLTIRKAMLEHHGYESATEGDAFYIAFHTAENAVYFAMSVTDALLLCDWPPLLLEFPLCMPAYGTSLYSWELQGNVQKRASQAALSWQLQTVAEIDSRNRDSIRTLASDASLLDESRLKPVAQQPSFSRTGHLVSASSIIAAVIAETGDQASDDGGPRNPSQSAALYESWRMVEPSGVHSEGFESRPASLCSQDTSSMVESTSVLGFIKRMLSPADGPGPGRLLLFNGLRVRMGMHTGVCMEKEMQVNNTTSRVVYSGGIAAMAKLVQDAAQGGRVLMSFNTFKALRVEQLNAKLILGHMGEHTLEDGQPPVQLYVAVSPTLIHRCATLGPIRSIKQSSPGFLQAPHSWAAIAYMHTVGTASLMSWNAEVTRSALKIYQDIAQALMWDLGGYPVLQTDGLLLIAFHGPAPALHWALCTLRAGLAAPWPAELLEHELGEEVSMQTLGKAQTSYGRPLRNAPNTVARGAPVNPSRVTFSPQGRKHVLFRGLRLKCGVDVGPATSNIEPVSARINYHGKVMNRAARVSAISKTGQVWVSQQAWDLAAPTAPLAGRDSQVSCLNLGASQSQPGIPVTPEISFVVPVALSGSRLRPPHVTNNPSIIAVHASMNDTAMMPTTHPGARGSEISTFTSPFSLAGAQNSIAAFACAQETVEPLMAISQGMHKLRGVDGEQHLLEIRFAGTSGAEGGDEAAGRAWSAAQPASPTAASAPAPAFLEPGRLANARLLSTVPHLTWSGQLQPIKSVM